MNFVSYLLWPVLLAGAIAANYFGMQSAHPLLWFNASYFMLAGLLFALERIMPHEREWLEPDGQLFPNLGHTLLSKAAVQALIVAITGISANAIAPSGAAWWPHEWPLAAQVVLGLTIAEFGFYWAHRMAHEWTLLWRFHAVHHSVVRLWFVNTGRFHFVDTLVSVAFGLAVAFVVGMPKDIIIWVSVITAYIGLLTHCNVVMRTGLLDYVFNTPTIHRWHHSMEPAEGNRNYGENLMLFDMVFGTFLKPDRRPPVEIGIRAFMPTTLAKQILHPFRHASTL